MTSSFLEKNKLKKNPKINIQKKNFENPLVSDKDIKTVRFTCLRFARQVSSPYCYLTVSKLKYFGDKHHDTCFWWQNQIVRDILAYWWKFVTNISILSPFTQSTLMSPNIDVTNIAVTHSSNTLNNFDIIMLIWRHSYSKYFRLTIKNFDL